MYTQYAAHILRQSDGALIPFDENNADYRSFLSWRDVPGNTPAQPAAPTLGERAAALLRAVDAHLNAAAQAKGYDSILSAALRAALPQSPFHAEGVAFGNWMDETYSRCYELLGQVGGAEIDEPTEAELIAMLPVLVLPA